MGEVVSFQVLHDDVGATVRERTHVEHSHYMLTLNTRTGPRFTLEALCGLVLLQTLRVQKLDRDLLLQLQMKRERDHAHCPRAEESVDAILVVDDCPKLHG